MGKSVNEILRRLDSVKSAIYKLEKRHTEVTLDEYYWVRVTEKSFVFKRKDRPGNVSCIPRHCLHTSTFKPNIPDHPYIDLVTTYLSLPEVREIKV